MTRNQTEKKSAHWWFPAKRYGWGWGLPSKWQGWLVLVAYLVLIGGACFMVTTRPVLFACIVLGSTTALIAICWHMGEPPRWRWGDDENGDAADR